MSRKNFLFANTPSGAESSAVVFSLIQMRKQFIVGSHPIGHIFLNGRVKNVNFIENPFQMGGSISQSTDIAVTHKEAIAPVRTALRVMPGLSANKFFIRFLHKILLNDRTPLRFFIAFQGRIC